MKQIAARPLSSLAWISALSIAVVIALVFFSEPVTSALRDSTAFLNGRLTLYRRGAISPRLGFSRVPSGPASPEEFRIVSACCGPSETPEELASARDRAHAASLRWGGSNYWLRLPPFDVSLWWPVATLAGAAVAGLSVARRRRPRGFDLNVRSLPSPP